MSAPSVPNPLTVHRVWPQLVTSPIGVATAGPTAAASEYGAYLKRFTDSVQKEWETILANQQLYPASGITVTVKFVIDAQGRIIRISRVEGLSEAAARACVTAILNKAPYGPWPSAMKSVWGEQQEMTFSFIYQ